MLLLIRLIGVFTMQFQRCFPAMIHHCKQVDNEQTLKESNIPMLTIIKSVNTQMDEKKYNTSIQQADKEIIENKIEYFCLVVNE